MAMKIVILEDNPERAATMRHCLADRFYQYDAQFFDDAAMMKDYLEVNLPETLLICLDHDLELKSTPTGESLDPGTGRDVADYLSSKTPVCPVVIHTTNSAAGQGMEAILKDARWKTFR